MDVDILNFKKEDVRVLLRNKFVIVIGDSVQRGIYKDIVASLQTSELMEEDYLKRKGERCHMGDELVEGGCLGELTNKKSYTEVRQYQSHYHLIRFYFVTRCYSEYVETIYADLEKDEFVPDIVIMNSLLWDISRYGYKGMEAYKKNLQITIQRFKEVLSEHTLFIWNTTMPVAKHITGGFLTKEIQSYSEFVRSDVMTANYLCAQIVNDYGFDVLDLHHLFNDEVYASHRMEDGVHWDAWVHRRITMYILRHVHDAWDIPLPRNNFVSSGRTVGHQRSFTDNITDTLTYKGTQLVPSSKTLLPTKIGSSTKCDIYGPGRDSLKVLDSDQPTPERKTLLPTPDTRNTDVVTCGTGKDYFDLEGDSINNNKSYKIKSDLALSHSRYSPYN